MDGKEMSTINKGHNWGWKIFINITECFLDKFFVLTKFSSFLGKLHKVYEYNIQHIKIIFKSIINTQKLLLSTNVLQL